jgi:hypothetical protein
MTRHIPTDLAAKVEAVRAAATAAVSGPRRAFHMSAEVKPGVRLVVADAEGAAIVFSLWSEERDIAEICGDAAYPATAGLLAIDKAQVADLSRRGVTVDLAALVRSETLPGLYYALFDHLSEPQLRRGLARLVPALTDKL